MRLIWTLIIWFDITLIPFSVMYVFLVILTRLSPHFIKLILRNDFNGVNCSTSEMKHIIIQRQNHWIFYLLHFLCFLNTFLSNFIHCMRWISWRHKYQKCYCENITFIQPGILTIISICDDKCHTTHGIMVEILPIRRQTQNSSCFKNVLSIKRTVIKYTKYTITSYRLWCVDSLN